MSIIDESTADMIRGRHPFTAPWLVGYRSKGGTFIIASDGKQNDNRKPRDLLAILPGNLGQGQVVQLYIAVAPELVAEVEAVLA